MSHRLLVIQHVPSAPPALYGAVLAERSCRVRLVDCERGGLPPAEPHGLDGIISLGGPMSVYEPDGLAWIDAERELLRRAVETDVPVLGVCLGAQLLAAALGAKVFGGGAPEIGPGPVRLTPAAEDDPVFAGLPGIVPVFHWHADTFELPPGADLLAGSDAYPNQAFRAGGSAYGVQFHAETSVELVRGMIELPPTAAQLARAPGAGARRLPRDAAEQMPAINAVGRHLITGWLLASAPLAPLLDRPPGTKPRGRAGRRREAQRAQAVRGSAIGVRTRSTCSRRCSNAGGRMSASPRCAGSSSSAKPGPSVAISKRTPLGSRK